MRRGLVQIKPHNYMLCLTNTRQTESKGMAKSTFNNCLYLALVVCSFDVVSAQELRKPAPYDFRDSDQYRALDETSRSRLETVVNDLEQLERALDSFMKDHDGAPPEKLEELVPKYIDSLPEDPFAAPNACTRPDPRWCNLRRCR